MNFGKQEIFHSGDKFRGYVVERLLGNGSLGAVYLVRHEVLDTVYALKALFPEVAKENEDYVKRFLREAKIATRIRHPNLVAVHDCGYDEARGLYYIVMDYVSGGDLRQALAFAGRFSPDRAVEVVLQVASALDAAQEYHVVHRPRPTGFAIPCAPRRKASSALPLTSPPSRRSTLLRWTFAPTYTRSASSSSR